MRSWSPHASRRSPRTGKCGTPRKKAPRARFTSLRRQNGSVVSGRATVTPCDGSPSFNVGPGGAVYFMAGFRCTWHIHEAPLVNESPFFSEKVSSERARSATTPPARQTVGWRHWCHYHQCSDPPLHDPLPPLERVLSTCVDSAGRSVPRGRDCRRGPVPFPSKQQA